MQVTIESVATADFLHHYTRIQVTEYYQGKRKRVYAMIPEEMTLDGVYLSETINRLIQTLKDRLGV
jgi:hypothetical protein